MAATVVLSSSLRSVSPEVALPHARELAARLGVTRVTDTTRLDRVGLPVYASIRPCAVPGSLCVSAGKGLHAIEAEVGATMEAIELSLAEPGASHVRIVRATARDVLDGRKRPEAILDLCPRVGARIALDAPMECVGAEAIASGERVLIPAELVFVPYRPARPFRSLFGASSNGLSSGHGVLEATVHGLAEVIERDVTSFEAVRDTSEPLDLASVDAPAARAIVETVLASGLELYVRHARNVFGLPYFFAMISDPEALAPHLLNGGFGCHPHRSVALVRAVAEAAQSRLSFIHGGRDDLTDVHDRYRRLGRARKRAFVERAVARAAAGRKVAYATVDDCAVEATSVESALGLLLDRLRAAGLPRAYCVRLSRPKETIQVTRVIVPGLEMFSAALRRMGPRLRERARAH